MKNKLTIVTGMLLVFTFIMAACAPAATPSPSSQQPAVTSQPAATTEPTLPQPAASMQPVKLKLSVLPFLSHAPFFIAQDEGYFAEQGLQVEFVNIDKTSAAMPALSQGQIDVAAGNFDASTLNVIAKGGGIQYVSDKGYLDPNGCAAVTWVVRKDLLDSGKLNDLKNLKGMKISLTPASSMEYALDMLLKDTGLTSKDVQILDLPLPTRVEGLKNGSIDIALLSDPWIVRAVNNASGVVWHPWQEYLPNLQFSVIMFGPNLLEKNRDVGTRFLEAYLKSVKQYNQGKTDRNVEIVSKYTKLTPAEVKQSCWMSMRPDGKMDLSGMQPLQQWAKDRGYLVSLVPNDKLADLTLLQAANQAFASQP
jgi:ABC-type nitrate/sulfonate/bicarbonate transport system substrate-binding protein